MGEGLRREWRLVDLVLFHTAAIVSLRWVSLAASTGPASLALWGLAFAAFFVPAASVVIAFSRRSPVEGGFYHWTKEAFGPFHAFLCAWSYLVSNLVYFPALLVAIAGYAAPVLSSDPDLARSPTFVLLFSLAALWLVLLLNLVGVRIGKWVENLGGLALWIPCALLVGLAAFLVLRRGSATPLEGFAPSLGRLDTWRLWSSICFGFAGLELATTMSGEIRDPARTMPRSVYAAGSAVVAIYALGTLATMASVEASRLDPVTGILQAIGVGLDEAGAGALRTAVALLLAVGGLGALGAWLAGSARLPFVLGVDRHLPAALGRLHPRFGTPAVSLLWQGAISSAIVVLATAGEKVRTSYDVLNNATTVLYFLPFLYLFGAHLRTFAGPRGSGLGASLLSGAGLLSTGVALALALVPPADSGSVFRYLLKVAGGCVAFLVVGALLFHRGNRAH